MFARSLLRTARRTWLTGSLLEALGGGGATSTLDSAPRVCRRDEQRLLSEELAGLDWT